jgi:hypothetical protein
VRKRYVRVLLASSSSLFEEMTIFRAGAEKMEILLRFEKDDRDIVVAPTREEVSKDDLPRITSTIASNNDDDMSHARTKEMPRTTTVETPESTFSNKDDVESAKDEDTFQVNPKQRPRTTTPLHRGNPSQQGGIPH